MQAVELVPLAAGEVGHHDRHGAVVDGDFGEFHEGAPFGGVIDVLVQRETVVQAVDEAVVHDEVHAAVAAHFLGLGFNLLCDGMEVFG